MKYTQQTLLQDEKIIYFTRPHWIVFTSGPIIWVAALILMILGPDYFILRSPIWNQLVLYQFVALLCFLVGIYWLIQSAILFFNTEYVVTNKRVLMKTGWIQRESLELFLQKVEAIEVEQSVLGRILNYGILIITGTGGTPNFYRFVPDPLLFRKEVQQQTALVLDRD